MKPLSMDLRQRVLEALEDEPSSLKVAKRFKVSGSAVRKLRLKVKRTGSLEPRPLPGRERMVKGSVEEDLRRIVDEYPDATLKVLCELLADQSGVSVSETTMFRQLQRMGFAQKKALYASEQNRPDVIELRDHFRRNMRRLPSARLIFIDESGVNLGLTRAEARAPRGKRIVDYAPGNSWESYSVVAGLRRTGVIAPMLLKGAMNTSSLLAWVKSELGPKLGPGDIVVWDNLSIHYNPEVARVIKERGACLRFLPPYSPEFNPIEKAWSKMKALLRVIKARSFDALVAGVGEALGAVTPEDSEGWFAHAGYAVS